MPRRLTAAAIVTVLAVMGAARASHAQVIRGDVTDSASHAPLLGSLVVAYDSAGVRVAGAITDDSGRFAIRLGAPGRYQLRVERIGYASRAMIPVEVAPGATLTEHLSTPSVAVVLPTVSVLSDSKCVTGPTEGEETAVLWTEARKALYATELGEDGTIYAVRHWYWRELNGPTYSVLREKNRTDTVLLARPWATPVSPEQLARDGYAIDKAGDSLAAPDAIVLLSESFARTHCFRLSRDPDKAPGLIGIAFTPSLKRHVPDVAGVLWLDSASAKLRYVTFRHTNLFPEVSPTKYGGRMDFEQLPSGAWIVRRWFVRVPVIGSGQQVAAWDETGGDLLTATVVRRVTPP